MMTIYLYGLIGLVVFIGTYILLEKVIFPWLIEKRTIELEKNPKWLMTKLQDRYYGFRDLDIILVDSIEELPKFRYIKKENQLQLLLSDDISVSDIDTIAKIALLGRIKLEYGLWYPEKSAHWLSICYYILNGGDIKIDATKWEKRQEIS